MTKTIEDNDVTDRIGVIYAKNNTKVSWTMESGALCCENKIEQWCDQS